jgi:hypothetical protein
MAENAHGWFCRKDPRFYAVKAFECCLDKAVKLITCIIPDGTTALVRVNDVPLEKAVIGMKSAYNLHTSAKGIQNRQ